MKYEYDDILECFTRQDGRGRKLWVNIVEARKIIGLSRLGYSADQIFSKIMFVNKSKVKLSTINTLINLVNELLIDLDKDYPLPQQCPIKEYDDIENSDFEARLYSLEDELVRKNYLETYPPKKSLWEKVKSWIF